MQPSGCLLSTRSQSAAYFSPVREAGQVKGAQHGGHQAPRGYHRARQALLETGDTLVPA
jgi:hypothetical protein